MKKNYYIYIISSILLIFYGLFIAYTKKLPQGNSGMGTEYVDIGNWAYLLSSIFLSSGIYILYKMFKK